ncbi:MAG: 23S rRNA (uracil(1939)-C(5))-methyltransferase RlmD [Defluviitaleaceae bacterium]|nr:23S rRNA (uracil(1939)-C(5))-methyltransferase RlmD [Defluviitaleaceae bacterium]
MLCEHFGRCGGCSYLDISYEDEIAIKKAALVETLGEYAEFLDTEMKLGLRGDISTTCQSGERGYAPLLDTRTELGLRGDIPTTLQSEKRGNGPYRNKMEFAFGDESKDGKLALGIRKKRSFYEVAAPTNCCLINDDFRKIVEYVTNFFREAGETFYHRKKHTGALRHLVLRRGEFTGEILVLLSASSALACPMEKFTEGLLSLEISGKIVGVMHSVNDGVADAVKNENVTQLYGRDYYYEKICGLEFKVSAFSFFQTNSRGAQVLYGVVSDLAGEGGTALDLYCGTGTISQVISPKFERVVGVEIVADAIAAAKENAAANRIANCEFYAGDAFAVLQELEISPNTIIVDPPRDGLHPKALQKIADMGECLVYVACKPKSLARDLPILLQSGYKLVKITSVDMFPRTPHVECVALLRR